MIYFSQVYILKMNIVDWYNDEVIKIWKTFYIKNNLQYVPSVLQYFKTNIEILFVGFNPSYDEKWHAKQFEKHNELKNSNFNSKNLFDWQGDLKGDQLNTLKEHEKRHIEHPYFKQFDNVSSNHHWEHIDLFLFRETNQENGIKKIMKDKSEDELNDFGKAQIDLFKNLLLKVKPKLIVLCNAKVSHIISKYFFPSKIQPTSIDVWDENLKIIYASMLTGQRSMDIYSRERLKEQILKEL